MHTISISALVGYLPMQVVLHEDVTQLRTMSHQGSNNEQKVKRKEVFLGKGWSSALIDCRRWH